MRRLLLLLAIAAAAGAGIWLALNRSGSAEANIRVASLVPRDTLLLVHLPDFKRTREQWRETDLYKLWREPAVQEFLQKPRQHLSAHTAGAEGRMLELERLGLKDGFAAVTAMSNGRATIVGGFRFRGSKSDAEKLIDAWVRRMFGDAADAPEETVQHHRHRVAVQRRGEQTLATVYDSDWFFAANDIAALTALLDRTNSRNADAAATLAADPSFSAVRKRMAEAYAGFGFARVDRLASELSVLRGENDATLASLRQIRSVSAATSFEGGKVRDTLFIETPKSAGQGELKREALALATPETFLFIAALLELPKDIAFQSSSPGALGGGFASGLQRVIESLRASGITADEWTQAFGAELGIIGDWPRNGRIPAVLATLPIKDAAKADELVARMTSATGEDSRWTVSERDSARYYSQPPGNPLIPVAPTIALGRERLIAGIDPASVEAALDRSVSSGVSGLAQSSTYTGAAAVLPAPRQSFTYVDSALLYSRLDAALRPMLIMSAAFVPAIAQAVDLNKVPAPEVITRHLSPIVISQRYEDGGYLTEYAGPASIFQTAAVVAVSSTSHTALERSDTSSSVTGRQPTPASSPTPEETR